MNSIFDHPGLPQAVVAILVKKLGGDVALTQDDFDAIPGVQLLEISAPDGTLQLTLKPKGATTQ